jgi:hypothetical protein
MFVEGASPQFPVYRVITARDFHGSAYQDSFLALRSGPYLGFPKTVSIETLALCNAACNFCPYPNLTRKGEAMPDSLIDKIFSDIEDIPARPAFEITLARVNEPFLDSRVMDISMDIERRFPEASSMFFSNGTPLTEKNLLRLSQLRRVSFLNVSLNDHRPKVYEAIMRLPFDKTFARLNLIQQMKASGVLKFPVYVSRVGDGTAADDEFLEWVRTTYPSLSGLVTPRGDWMGAIPGPLSPVPDVGCRQWFNLHLLSSGKSAFCCVDSDGRNGIGDARSEHVIHEIYNHPDKRKLRSAIASRLEVKACQVCPMLP